LEIDDGLWLGLIPGLDDLDGFVLFSRRKAGAFAGFGIDAIKGSAAVAPSNQAVTCFHGGHATTTINGTGSEELPGKRRVNSRDRGFKGSTEIGVRFRPTNSQFLAAKSVQNGASCRNRPFIAVFAE
jgi:hypothetical protein